MNFSVSDGCRQFDECEEKSRISKFLPLRTTLGEYSFKLHYQVEVNVIVCRVVYHVENAGYAFLSIFKFKWVFLLPLVIIHQQWLDEVNQLVNGASRHQLFIILYHSFADAQGHCSLVCKLHIVHESRVVMHSEDCNRQWLQWNRQQLHQKFHRRIIIVCQGCRLQDIAATVQYLVNIPNIGWVGLNHKIHEGNF